LFSRTTPLADECLFACSTLRRRCAGNAVCLLDHLNSLSYHVPSKHSARQGWWRWWWWFVCVCMCVCVWGGGGYLYFAHVRALPHEGPRVLMHTLMHAHTHTLARRLTHTPRRVSIHITCKLFSVHEQLHEPRNKSVCHSSDKRCAHSRAYKHTFLNRVKRV
jgi:hypothetical protein